MILALQTPGYGETSAPSNLPTANSTSLAAVTQTTITLFLGIAVIIAVILLVWSGIQWITSEGDQEKISQAKKTYCIYYYWSYLNFWCLLYSQQYRICFWY